jgi:RecA/RadA recombinase
MAGVLDRLLKNSTIKTSATLANSKFFEEKDMIQTQVPAVNVAFSGRLDGGITAGSHIFAGNSKNFKSAFLMLCIRAYLDKYDDGVCLFYDSEGGSPSQYFTSFGIDGTRVVHCPIMDIEQLKMDVMKQLNDLKEEDHVIIIIDSLGNLASKKEVDDALEGKSVADLSRAKAMKSLFRMITPYLNAKDIPMISSGHVYKEMALFPKDIMSGGTGAYYSSSSIFFISRSQEKDASTKEITGWNFTLTIEKSRLVKEKSKLTIEVSYDEGINPWSGLLDMALESCHVDNSTQGWYLKAGDDKKYRKNDTNNEAFWASILQEPKFQEFVRNKYTLASGSILQDLTEEDSGVTEHVETGANENETDGTFEDLKPKKKRAK